MTLHDANSFLEYRKQQEKIHLDRIKNSKNPLDSILKVEINATDYVIGHVYFVHDMIQRFILIVI